MFRKGPFIFFRLIGLLLVIGLIVGGGAMAYRAGIAQGVAQAPAVATAISKAAESGQSAPVLPPMMYGRPYGYGYGPGFYPGMGHHFFMFPFGALCFGLFFLFLFGGFMKMMFFRRMWAHRGDHGFGPPWMHHHNRGCDEENKDGDKKEEGKKE